jgi:LacI family transcriptional regulator
MITIKEIAKKAEVSEGTVDRVLHNRGGVSAKTEKKVKKIIEESKFKVNPIASALALKKKYKIGYLIPNYNEENPFWKYPYMGILKAYKEVENFGVQLLEYKFDQYNSASFLNQFAQLKEALPDIIILAPIFKEQTIQITEELDAINIPYIFLNINLDNLNNLSFIGQDSYKSGYAAGKLMSLSVQNKESCLTIKTRSNISNYLAIFKRINGFTDYLSENKSQINNISLTVDLSQLPIVKKELNSILEKNKAIKGVFVPSSRVGLISGIIDKEKLAHLHIIGFDTTEKNIKSLETNAVQFLISQKSFNQGYKAIRIIVDFLIYKKNPPKKIYSPIQIIFKENLEFASSHKKVFDREYSLTMNR